MPPNNIHELLLNLYRLSHDLPIHSFQDAALNEIKQLVAFDSCIWGTGTVKDGFQMNTIHLHQKSPEMLVEYEDVKGQDNLPVTLTRAPRVTVNVHSEQWFAGRDQRDIRHFLSQHEHENIIVSGTFDASRHSIHWMSLYRAHKDDINTEEERYLIDTLVPHMMQALALNRVSHLERITAPDRGLLPHGAAIVDTNGCIRHIDASLQALMRLEWNDWNNAMLPKELLGLVKAGSVQYAGRNCIIACKAEHGLLFLRGRPRYRADSLTAREHTIAGGIAKGLSYKEIAKQFNRSPATVRSQIQTIYYKLQVNNIASLIDEMRKASQ